MRAEQFKQSRAEFADALAAKAAELGENVGVDPRLIAKWEDGETGRPRPVYRRLLVALTRCSEHELGIAAPDSRPGVPSERPTSPPPVAAVDRRQFLTLTGASVFAIPAAGWTPQRVDPALVDYFRKQLAGHYEADMMLGPRALVATVVTQCNLIGRLIEEADAAVRTSLTEIGCAYAAFAGWLFLDASDAAGALHWHSAALELGHRSGNIEAVACSLVDRAMAHTDLGAGGAVVDLCGNALRFADRLSPEVQVFALQQQAHGASLLHNRREVDRLLDKAAQLVDRVDVEQWGTACLRTPGYVEVQRATCYGRLGEAIAADRLWQQIIPASPSVSRRDIGVWTARHARAKAQQGDPDQALGMARPAVALAIETGSARGARELKALAEDVRPWHDARVGRDLADVLAPVLKGA
ncbi:Twin-arginine translocation pathway signal [Uniformispora flossi]|uniref:Twin-arginine translocation pathway signal n=1 Tax=Uniformispora flossi TaxID=3390723 RepID=UPI003C3062AC